MSITTDELTTPLGVDRVEPRPRGSGRAVAIVACLIAVGAIGAAGFVAVFGDPLGGLPHVRVDIATRPSDAPRSESAGPGSRPAPPSDVPSRQSAVEVETVSGVTVTRPQGSSAPDAVIVRVPDDPGARLRPAPDPRLADRTRFGTLPRLGPEGARALDVYARPEGELVGGMRPKGRIAIVVGGLGISQSGTAAAVSKLPGAVTLAFAPYGAELDRLAAGARTDGHEIMLHVPMEPFDYPDSDPGPHTLTTSAKPAENIEHLHWAMGRFAGYVGLMNYMGGKLTSDERALAPILREAGGRGLAFLDDGSSSRSLVTGLAGTTPAARADVVLDSSPRADAIDKALARLEALASAGDRVAVGVAAALPLSIERIERWAKGLEERGILLVPASTALRAKTRESATR